MRVVIVGSGPAGFSAAVVAKRAGADVILLERMNMLGGLGFQAGIYEWPSPSGDIALTEEKALGGGDLFEIFESIAIHKRIDLPNFGNISTYNVLKLDSSLQKALKDSEIKFMLRKRVVDIEVSGNRVEAVVLKDGDKIEGDVFIDATGAMRGTADCTRWGYGCVGCSLQCATFGPPGDMIGKKVKTVAEQNDYAREIGQWGSVGTSVKIALGSLSEAVQKELNENGWIQVRVPPGVKPDMERVKRTGKVDTVIYGNVQGFFGQHLTVVDIGKIGKLTTVAAQLYAGSLRTIPGFEDAVILDPVAGEMGHLIHMTTVALRDNSLRVDGFDNLFCAGNKAGVAEGLLDAMVTGELAGYNAVRSGLGHGYLELPRTLAVGAFIDHAGKMMRSAEGRKRTYSLLSAELLKTLNVCRENMEEIVKEVDRVGLSGIYKTKLC